MAIKSLTGSRKVVDLLNRLGHCASNSTIEELETKLTFEATKDRSSHPEVFLGKGVLKIYSKFTGEHPC